MPRPRVSDIQSSFTGLNTTAAEDQLGPTEVRQAANVKFTAYGAATRRGGTQRVHSSALFVGAPVQGGYYWDSQALHLVVAFGTLYTSPGGAFPWTWTQRGAANFFSNTAKISFTTFISSSNGGNEVVYMADGGTLALWATGPGLIRIIGGGTPASVTFLAVQNKRLFGVNGVDPTLYWSSLGDGNDLGIPSTPDAGGNDFIRTIGESSLQSLLPMAAGLVILHKRGTSTFTGWSQNDISIASGTAGISADIGTLAPFGNVAVENNAFVFSDRGIYQLTPFGIYEQISKPIESVLNGLSRTLFAQIVAAHDKVQRQVYFMIPTLGIYCWNYRTNGWSGPWTGIYSPAGTACGALWSSVDQNNTPIVLGGFNDSFVRQTEVPGIYSDDVLANGTGGFTYTLTLQTRHLLADDPFSLKFVRWIYAMIGGQGVYPSLVPPGVIQWGFGPTPTFTALPSGSVSAPSGTAAVPWRFQGAGHGAWVSIFVNDSTASALYYSRLGAEGFDYGRSRYAVGGGGNPGPGVISAGSS